MVMRITVLGSTIRDLRLRRDWSQHDLASHADITQAQVANLESGKTQDPKLSTVIRLARAFDMSLIEFLSLSSTGEVLAAELSAAGRSRKEVQELLTIWPRLAQRDKRRLIRDALAWIDEAGQDAE